MKVLRHAYKQIKFLYMNTETKAKIEILSLLHRVIRVYIISRCFTPSINPLKTNPTAMPTFNSVLVSPLEVCPDMGFQLALLNALQQNPSKVDTCLKRTKILAPKKILHERDSSL